MMFGEKATALAIFVVAALLASVNAQECDVCHINYAHKVCERFFIILTE